MHHSHPHAAPRIQFTTQNSKFPVAPLRKKSKAGNWGRKIEGRLKILSLGDLLCIGNHSEKQRKAQDLELHEALERLNVIHDQVARGEVYRGYRSWSIGASGLGSIAAAAFQPVQVDSPQRFVLYWCGVATLCGLVAASEVVVNYFARGDAHHRRTTRRVTGQLIPALFAGAVVTLAFLITNPALVALLPGLWAVLFGLGIFSSRPYLPRATGYVALAYLIAGTWLLLRSRVGELPSPWHVGLTFGAGQLVAALVLYWNLERVQE